MNKSFSNNQKSDLLSLVKDCDILALDSVLDELTMAKQIEYVKKYTLTVSHHQLTKTEDGRPDTGMLTETTRASKHQQKNRFGKSLLHSIFPMSTLKS